MSLLRALCRMGHTHPRRISGLLARCQLELIIGGMRSTPKLAWKASCKSCNHHKACLQRWLPCSHLFDPISASYHISTDLWRLHAVVDSSSCNIEVQNMDGELCQELDPPDRESTMRDLQFCAFHPYQFLKSH